MPGQTEAESAMLKGVRVLIGPTLFGAGNPTPIERLRQMGADVVANPYGRRLSKDDLRMLLPGAAGLIAGLEPLSRDVLEQSGLKVISRCGTGLSNVDLEAAERLGIIVKHTPDIPTTAVAELTVGAMIALMRHLPAMDRDLHSGTWEKRMGRQLEGKTVLLVGYGRIGQRVAALLRPFNVRVLAADPALRHAMDGVAVLPLEEALPQADVISLHASGEAEILGEREFARMKPEVFLLNAGRGGLVNEPALCRALDRGIVAGAWLDTFVEEPYAGPLTRYPQVLLTPHIGSASLECRTRMELAAVENLLEAFASFSTGR